MKPFKATVELYVALNQCIVVFAASYLVAAEVHDSKRVLLNPSQC